MNCRFFSIGQQPLGPDGQPKLKQSEDTTHFRIKAAAGTTEDPEERARCTKRAREETELLSRCIELQDKLARIAEKEQPDTARLSASQGPGAAGDVAKAPGPSTPSCASTSSSAKRSSAG